MGGEEGRGRNEINWDVIHTISTVVTIIVTGGWDNHVCAE